MADNYLEKKMEDMRSGRLAHIAGKRGVSQKGMWCVDFPCRRVLVTDGTGVMGRTVINEFCRIGCRVAFLSEDVAMGKEIAQATGARFIQCVTADAAGLESAIDGLVKAWRDIDIIVNVAFDRMQELLAAVGRHRERLPYPNDYGGRLINVVPSSATAKLCYDTLKIVRKYGFTVNIIAVKDDGTAAQAVARSCVFLSAPGSESIDGSEIVVDRI